LTGKKIEEPDFIKVKGNKHKLKKKRRKNVSWGGWKGLISQKLKKKGKE